MAELQFKIDNNALETVRNTPINANFDEMKEALTEFVEPYTKVLVSEDSISTAKSDRAKLRSVANHIDSYRKSVKNVYSEPLKAFEEKCKELTSIIDTGVKNLDVQVKAYETRRKEEKIFLVRQYFDTAESNMQNRGFITWEMVFNQRWENTTYKIEDCHKDIDLVIAQTESEVYAIKSLHSEFELSLLDCYKAEHSLPKVMQMNERLKEQKRQEEERRLAKERYEIEQQKVAAQEPEAETISIADPSHLFCAAPESEQPMPEAEPVYCATYKVWATDKDLNALSSLLKNLKVKYQTINVTRVN